MDPYKVAGELGQAPGFAFPAGKQAAEVLTKYLVIDMYAEAIQGGSAEEAVRWAEAELGKVCA
jgi:multiple sugar transport system substrate-binding protein